jgi:hypothetical protein
MCGLIKSIPFLFFQNIVSDPVYDNLTTNLYSVYEATTVSVPNASRSATTKFVNISANPNLSGSIFVQNII